MSATEVWCLVAVIAAAVAAALYAVAPHALESYTGRAAPALACGALLALAAALWVALP